MRIGVCTTDFARRGMDRLFSDIAELGFECAQFAFASIDEAECEVTGAIEIPEFIPEGLPGRIVKSARARGLSVAALNGTYNMAHPDADVRAEGAKRFLTLLEAASAMEVPFITICTGSRSLESLWKRHPDTGSAEAFFDMEENMALILPRAEKLGVTLLIETEAANTVSTPERARRLMDDMGSPNLKIVLDPANLFLPGTARPENARGTLDDAFARFGGDILLAHGKDIRAGGDIDFCATGLGIVDFPYMLSRLKELGFAGDMVLHGIYDETDMPRALGFMRALVRSAAI